MDEERKKERKKWEGEEEKCVNEEKQERKLKKGERNEGCIYIYNVKSLHVGSMDGVIAE